MVTIMRHRSFSKTTRQMRESTPDNILKDITRRWNWSFARPGLHTLAVEKCQGLKKGEHPIPIRECVDVAINREPLMDIVRRPYRDGKYEVAREGFPQWIGQEIKFVEMLLETDNPKKIKVWAETPLTRIEFRHIFNYPVQAKVIAEAY
jgi:hypothetical protein